MLLKDFKLDDLQTILANHDGELQQSQRNLKEVSEKNMPPELYNATNNFDHFKTLMNTTKYTPVSRLKDEAEYSRLEKLAIAEEEFKEALSMEIEVARLKSVQLEDSLLWWIRRAHHLENDIKPKTLGEITHNNSRITNFKYEIDRDTGFLMSEISKKNCEIEVLQEQLDHPENFKKLFGKSTITIDPIKVELNLNRLKVEKQNMLNQYPQHQKWVEGIENEIRILEHYNKVHRDNYQDAVNEVKAAILRIAGINLELEELI